MSPRRARKFGLIGTITKDFITSDPGVARGRGRKEKGIVSGAVPDTAHGKLPKSFSGHVPGSLLGTGKWSAESVRLGGILYQAAALCGFNEEVLLYSNVGQELLDEVIAVIGGWTTLRTSGIRPVAGPGNRVHLHYPGKGERREILESTVCGLDSEPILHDLPRLDFLIAAINSGFDIELKDWRRILGEARNPTWLDIHSLVLTKVLNAERQYRALPDWREWVEGVAYLQANRKEAACMLGRPDEEEDWPPADSEEMGRFSEEAFAVGVRAMFLTLGKEGVLVMTPGARAIIPSPRASHLIDTTGCGDVFCAAAAARLARGEDPFVAAEHGVDLASRAASVSGIQGTYELARLFAQH